MNDWVVTVIVAVIAAAPGLAALWRGRKREDAEAETSYQALYEKSVMRIAQLEKRVTKLEGVIEQFEDVLAGAHKLFHQVQSLGAQPVYQPPDRRITQLGSEDA